MLAWAVFQELVLHRRPVWPPLTIINAAVDLSALTCLLLGYGLLGQADLAVKSPVWLMYFLILAARPFTGSARGAAVATGIAVAQYAGLVAFFTLTHRLRIVADPLATVGSSGTSLFDEGTKLLFLTLAGCVATYATAWSERTLEQAVI